LLAHNFTFDRRYVNYCMSWRQIRAYMDGWVSMQRRMHGSGNDEEEDMQESPVEVAPDDQEALMRYMTGRPKADG